MILPQAVSAAPSGDTQTEKAERTILLYIRSADLESESAMATYNLEQIMDAEFSAGGDVKLLVMTGGSLEWYFDGDYLRDPDDLGLAVNEETGEYTIS